MAWYDFKVKNAVSVKKTIEMNGYTRAAPAIKCDSRETLNLMRETASIYTDDKVAESQVLLYTAFGISIATIGIVIGGMITIFCAARKCLDRGCFAVMCPAICTIISLGFSLGVVSIAGSAKSSFEEDKLLIEDLYGNAECGDPLSRGIGSIMYEKVKDRSDAGIDGASFLAMFGTFALFQTLFAAFVVCGLILASNLCKKSKPEKSKSSSKGKSSSSSSSD